MYPSTLVITCEVFKTGKIVYTNNMKSLSVFLPSIDNLSNNVEDVRSILVLPIFGHREKDDPNVKPIAVFQFVNKCDFKNISEYDIVSITSTNNFSVNLQRFQI